MSTFYKKFFLNMPTVNALEVMSLHVVHINHVDDGELVLDGAPVRDDWTDEVSGSVQIVALTGSARIMFRIVNKKTRDNAIHKIDTMIDGLIAFREALRSQSVHLQEISD